jgi:thioesterase domain-containing protein
LGRNDFQVKVRGFRIELGEIEARLGKCGGVGEAVVIAREESNGDKRLVAYVVAREAGAELSVAELRRELGKVLPEYMVPSAFVRLEVLPLTANGKLDRKALPAPDESSVVRRTYEAPEGEIEMVIAEIWQELLGLEHVGRHDNFFELGGHSLLAIKLLYYINRRFNTTLRLAAILASPTVTSLAIALALRRHSASLLVPLQVEGAAKAIFCIHPVGGEVSCYRRLAQSFGREISVYSIQSPEAAGLLTGFDTIEQMASTYCEVIKTTQAAGPYRLLGWSSGGIIAIAVATCLRDQGCTVEYIALLDSNLSAGKVEMTDEQLAFTAITSAVAAIRGNSFSTNELVDMADTLREMNMSAEDVLKMENRAVGIQYVKRWTESGLSDEVLEHVKQHMTVTFDHLKLLRGFSPKAIEASFHLFYLKETSSSSPRCGKVDVASKGSLIKIERVNGNHYSMLASPHVLRLARRILAFLEGNTSDTTKRAGAGLGQTL